MTKQTSLDDAPKGQTLLRPEGVKTKFVQGIHVMCSGCKKPVNPVMFVWNDKDGLTEKLEFACPDCTRTLCVLYVHEKFK